VVKGFNVKGMGGPDGFNIQQERSLAYLRSRETRGAAHLVKLAGRLEKPVLGGINDGGGFVMDGVQRMKS